MAQKYYSAKETAQVLGISEDEVKQMLANRQLHAYRGDADWKFKVEDIDELAKQPPAEPGLPGEDEADVLLSEVELGASDPGASGTVIGLDNGGRAAADSDIKLSGDSEATAGQDDVGSKVTQFEELDLTLDEDLTLEEPGAEGGSAGGSAIDLAGGDLEDDDLVLGGSGTGSGITIGGDSGISLVDPTDSGLSLDEPLELADTGSESLELGEDDMITLGEEADVDAPTELKTDDDFLLTPLEEVGDEESESGSQVIALDSEGEGDEAATMIASQPVGSSMAAMLDEDLSSEPVGDLGIGAPLDAAGVATAAMPGQPGGFAEGAPVVSSGAAALPEAPYSVWNILGLALCSVFLIGCGMFMYDLLRNMWSWDSPYSVNSSMMDWILGWFEG